MSEPVPSTVTDSSPCCSTKDDKNKITKTEAALQRCSENMQQIHKQTPMPKCHFSKVAQQLYWNQTSAWVFSCKFAGDSRKNTSGVLLLQKINCVHGNLWCNTEAYLESSRISAMEFFCKNSLFLLDVNYFRKNGLS